jgi:hypothetical protein
MVVSKGIEQISVVLFHREVDSGRRAPAVLTTAEAWDERVSQMRVELKDIAQCAQQSIRERFPDDVQCRTTGACCRWASSCSLSCSGICLLKTNRVNAREQ